MMTWQWSSQEAEADEAKAEQALAVATRRRIEKRSNEPFPM
jgi:hypothetical protein